MRGALATLSFSLLAAGCSLLAPTTQQLSLTSEPSGATVVINGVEKGQTPLQVAVSKAGATPVNLVWSEPPTIEFQLEGHESRVLRPRAQKLSPTGWLDTLTGGVIVSMFSPGFWSFDKKAYSMRLDPTGAPNPLFDTQQLAGPGGYGPQGGSPEPVFGSGYSQRIAITIGIDRYAAWPPLEGGRRDAMRVATRLRELGFDEVLEVYDEDATRVRLLRLLGSELVSLSDSESLVLIYFAGHGQTETLANGERRGYIVPADADTTDSFATAISMEKIRDLSRRIPAKHLYYAMDSCYSGLGLTRGIALNPTTVQYAEKVTSRRAVQMMTAGGEGEQAIEIGGRGIFTSYLLEALEGAADANADGYVSASEIGGFVRPRVSGASKVRQNPQFGTLDGSGEILLQLGR